MPRLRTLLAVTAAFAALAGCSNNDGLSVRGSVVSEGSGEFNFAMDYRLDSPPEGLDGVFTGQCEMAQVAGADGLPAWGVVATIRRGNNVDDLGLASVTLMQRTDAEATAGRVEAVFGMTDYTSAGAGSCTLEIPYAEADSGIVGLTGTCDVMDVDGATEQLTIQLDLTGCAVID